MIHLLARRLVAATLVFASLPVAHAVEGNRTLGVMATPQQMKTEQRLALVIGNGNYLKGSLGQNPVNDASDIAKALQQMGFTVISVTDASKATMRAKIREFGTRLKNGGVGLFFYAGHGVQVSDQNYLLPVDADIQNEAEVAEDAISVNLVLKTMDDAGNRLNIVMLDACRDNPFTRGFRSAGTGLSAVNASDAATGMVIAFATAPGKTAANGDGRNGLWTSQLLKAFSGPDTSLMKVFQRATEGVWTSSNGVQKPWVNQSFIGEFWFNRKHVDAADPAIAGGGHPGASESVTTSSVSVPVGQNRASDKSNISDGESWGISYVFGYSLGGKIGKDLQTMDFESFRDGFVDGYGGAPAGVGDDEMAKLIGDVRSELERARSSDETARFSPPAEVIRKLAYSYGYGIGRKMTGDGISVDLDTFSDAFMTGFSGLKGRMSEEEMQVVFDSFSKEKTARQQADLAKRSADNMNKSIAFLNANSRRVGVFQTASGLQYEVLKPGRGGSPGLHDLVTVRYRGAFPDGTEFDRTEEGGSAQFALAQVLDGWQEGVQLMNRGAKYRFYLPPKLAYGDRGAGDAIGPNQALVFEVELIDFRAAAVRDK